MFTTLVTETPRRAATLCHHSPFEMLGNEWNFFQALLNQDTNNFLLK